MRRLGILPCLPKPGRRNSLEYSTKRAFSRRIAAVCASAFALSQRAQKALQSRISRSSIHAGPRHESASMRVYASASVLYSASASGCGSGGIFGCTGGSVRISGSSSGAESSDGAGTGAAGAACGSCFSARFGSALTTTAASPPADRIPAAIRLYCAAAKPSRISKNPMIMPLTERTAFPPLRFTRNAAGTFPDSKAVLHPAGRRRGRRRNRVPDKNAAR